MIFASKDAEPRLWIALSRPDNLVTALATVSVARKDFASCNLVFEKSKWWDKVQWRSYRDCFDEVHVVEKVATCRGLRDIVRFDRALRARQNQLKALGIAPQDVLFLLAGVTALSNALASAYPRVYKILCTTAQKYREANQAVSFQQYRHTTSGWLQNHFLESRAGLHRTLDLKPWRGRGDGIRLKRLAAPVEKIFDVIFLLSNDGLERPEGAGKATLARFPKLRELAGIVPSLTGQIGVGNRVIFFGTPFLLVRNLPPETYASRLNDCFDYLQRSYSTPYKLIYRPHPGETDERAYLRLGRFEVEDDAEVAELYFLRHAPEIAAVFSVSSTVSRVALNYGLNAYAFWRCFPFAPKAASYFESLMGSVPPEFHLASFNQPPQRYQPEQPATTDARDFSKVLPEVVIPSVAHQGCR